MFTNYLFTHKSRDSRGKKFKKRNFNTYSLCLLNIYLHIDYSIPLVKEILPFDVINIHCSSCLLNKSRGEKLIANLISFLRIKE